jgi:hypothetical protein
MAAEPDASVPWGQGMAERELKRLPQEGKIAHEAPPEERASTKSRRRRQARADTPRCHRRASACLRCQRERAGANLRRYHQIRSANAAPHRNAAQMRAIASPVGSGESRCTKSSCPPGKDQALGTGGRPTGERIFNLKRPVEAKKNDTAGIYTPNKTTDLTAWDCRGSGKPVRVAGRLLMVVVKAGGNVGVCSC